MTPAQLVHTLQLVDSFFPVGSFAYSDGLESAAASNRPPASLLAGWLDHYLDAVFVPCDGLALLKCMRAMERNDWEAIRSIDEELTALKPAAATRASSKSIGKGLIATYSAIVQNPEFRRITAILPQPNAPVAYGIVFAYQQLAARDALTAFGYTRMAGMVSAALRLVAMGQQQGQALLMDALNRLPLAAEQILQSEARPLRSFSPLMDVQQMNHRYVYSRLFRS